jgi:putative exosortase-associated protein (TIGR04073 family)
LHTGFEKRRLHSSAEAVLENPRMKRLLLSLTAILIAGATFADIQDPPMREYTATRKLGRAWANMFLGSSEIPTTIQREINLDGDSAAASYGLIKGVGRTFVRMGVGVYEFVTFPFPTYKRSYRPVLRAKVPWINHGYDEFPPELGFEARKRYTTLYDNY